eukprot:11590010-Prorocentrum_lima.AAC.1
MPSSLLPAFLRTGILLPSNGDYGDSAFTVVKKADKEIAHGVPVWDPRRVHCINSHCPLWNLSRAFPVAIWVAIQPSSGMYYN